MKKRSGFTIAELILATMIFGFMSISLATIYSTTNRHMFQNYRANIIKSNVGITMRAVQNNLSMATRIDAPAFNTAGNTLSFATNVDQLTGCYPISATDEVRWHHFCMAPDPTYTGLNSIFHHTGTLAGGTGCAAAAPTIWAPSYPAAGACGSAGGTITLMMQAAVPNPFFFSRRASEVKTVSGAPVTIAGVTERDQVLILLRSFWAASARGFGRSQRDVDFSLDSTARVNRYAP